MKKVSCIVPAAGSATRLGGGKMFREICGEPVIVHTIRALDSCRDIDEIIVAARPEDADIIGSLCSNFSKLSKIVFGGGTRCESVLLALVQTSAKYVAIHDGARPCVTPQLCSLTIKTAMHYNAAAPAISLVDTIKQIDDNSNITATLDRSTLRAIQTPQCFDTDIIKCALTDALNSSYELTDDCSAVEKLGMPVKTVKGDPFNIKITTSEDLVFAETILKLRSTVL